MKNLLKYANSSIPRSEEQRIQAKLIKYYI